MQLFHFHSQFGLLQHFKWSVRRSVWRIWSRRSTSNKEEKNIQEEKEDSEDGSKWHSQIVFHNVHKRGQHQWIQFTIWFFRYLLPQECTICSRSTHKLLCWASPLTAVYRCLWSRSHFSISIQSTAELSRHRNDTGWVTCSLLKHHERMCGDLQVPHEGDENPPGPTLLNDLHTR
jgi:hypothetical protein